MRSLLTTRLAALAAVMLPIFLALAAAAPAAAADLTQRCTNPDDGYSVSLPRGWYYNEYVEGGDVDDVAACRFFSPEDFEVRPASGVADVAISIGREATPPDAEGAETTVDGRRAIVLQTEASEDGFDPAGTRYYQYWIDMGDDWLVAGTSDGPTWVGEFEDNAEILDAMMDSLTFGTTRLPDTALPALAQPGAAAAAGLVTVMLAMGMAARAAVRDH